MRKALVIPPERSELAMSAAGELAEIAREQAAAIVELAEKLELTGEIETHALSAIRRRFALARTTLSELTKLAESG